MIHVRNLFAQGRDAVRQWSAIFSLFLFILLFAARGGKSEVIGGAILGFLLLTAAVTLKVNSSDGIMRHPIVSAALGFFCWALVSISFSHEISRGLLPLLKIAGCGAFWITACLNWGKKQRTLFNFFLMLVASIQATMAFCAHLGLYSFPLLLPGNPQYVAFWIALASLAAFDNAAKVSGARNRAGWALLMVYLTLALFALPSRSGFLALAAGVSFLSFRYFRWRGLLYGASIVLCGVVLAPNSLWSQSLKSRDPLAWKRMDIWRSTVKGIVEKPLIGWGPGNFENLYNVEALPQPSLPARFDRSTPFAHNDFLQAETLLSLPKNPANRRFLYVGRLTYFLISRILPAASILSFLLAFIFAIRSRTLMSSLIGQSFLRSGLFLIVIYIICRIFISRA